MKKLCLLTVLLLVCSNAIAASTVQSASVTTTEVSKIEVATNFDYLKPYIGLDGQIKSMPIKNSSIGPYRKYSFQPNGFAGLRFNNVGLEAGISHAKSKNMGNNHYKIWTSHISIMGYLDIQDCVEVFAGAGIGKLRNTFKSNPNELQINKGVFRGSLGVQRMFSDMFGVRASAVYEHTSRLQHSLLKANNSVNYSIGLIAKF